MLDMSRQSLKRKNDHADANDDMCDVIVALQPQGCPRRLNATMVARSALLRQLPDGSCTTSPVNIPFSTDQFDAWVRLSQARVDAPLEELVAALQVSAHLVSNSA